MSGLELFANDPQTTTTGTSGTTAPTGGTVESWTVASSSSFPSASSAAGTYFHIADPALTSEIILVTNVSGTTWTVTRGAESTTPVAHGTGATFNQVVTAGAFKTFPQVQFVTPSGDSSGATDPGVVIAAINALAAGNGGTVMLAPGTYYGNSTVTYAPSDSTIGPKVSIRGSGANATIWKYSGTGDAFRFYWPGNPGGSNTPFTVAGFSDMCFDGSLSSSGTARGLHIGDANGWYVERCNFTNWSTSGQIALYGDNTVKWTEKGHWQAWFTNCLNPVVLNQSSTGYPSWEYNYFELYFDCRAAGTTLLTIQNGAYLDGSEFFLKGNASPTTGNGILITGSSPVGAPGFNSNSHINNALVVVKIENSASTGGPVPINVTGGATGITDSTGTMIFAGSWGNSVITGAQFTFGGVIKGDTTLTGVNTKPNGWL